MSNVPTFINYYVQSTVSRMTYVQRTYYEQPTPFNSMDQTR
jgi:hypothetical protein